MKKMLFVACVNLDDEYSGITRKVVSQYNAFQGEFDTYLVGYHGANVAIISQSGKQVYEQKKGVHRRIAVMDMALNLVREKKIKNVYIRRLPLNPLVIRFLTLLKREGCRLLWEIPTYPYDYEPHKGLKSKTFFMMDKICRTSLRKFVDRIVTFSHEDEIFGCKTIVTGNGIDVAGIRERIVADNKDSLHLLAVAVLNNWHGYDRLIKGLAEYYHAGGQKQVFFHLVGDGPSLDEYKKLVNDLQIQEHVIFYGYQNKESIERIYDKCDMAVESLGWHRSHVVMGTSLKTREYVAKGMPILASTPMDIFPDGWEYAYYAPIDDSPIDVDAVVHFYEDILKNKDIQRLAAEIRDIAVKRMDMKIMMKPVLDYYSNNQE